MKKTKKTPASKDKAKDFFKRLEDFLHEDLESRFKEGYQELESFLKRGLKLDKVRDNLLEYDPDSPFSYIVAFLRDRTVASVAPSTRYVVNRVLRAMDLSRARVVVEFGPAEGVMTRRILARMAQGGTLVAVERNAHFVRALQNIRDPRLRVVHGDVQDIDTILKGLGIDHADVVVSGIPFSFFELHDRKRLLGKIRDLLNPGGRFIAYQFTTHLIPLLRQYFKKVRREFELRNLPPHFVFTCFK